MLVSDRATHQKTQRAPGKMKHSFINTGGKKCEAVLRIDDSSSETVEKEEGRELEKTK